MKSFFNLLLLCTLATSFGCMRINMESAMKTPVPPKVEEVFDLSNRSFSEVLEIKYKKAAVRCDLWTHIAKEQVGFAAMPPMDSFSLDLKSGYTLPFEFTLKGQHENHWLEAKIVVLELDLANQTLIHEGHKKTYTMSNSPRAKIEFSSSAKTVLDGGSVGESTSGTPFEINERVRDDSLNSARTINGNIKIVDLVQCFVDTEIKPGYENQYSVKDIE